jgi:tRNA G10  N-methylase Trm11
MPEEYFFIYGRTPELARVEARSVYPQISFSEVHSYVDAVSILPDDPSIVMQRLGGLVRIVKHENTFSEINPNVIAEGIHTYFQDQSSITFTISVVGDMSVPNHFFLEVKRALQNSHSHVRFISPTQGSMVSAFQLNQKDIVEFVLIESSTGILLCSTVAFQFAQDWSKRDFDRPSANAKRGMLPPKVARIAINIAVGPQSKNKIIADPFCGSGTVLSEGYMLGCTCFGSDISLQAVEDTRRNIQWLKGIEKIDTQDPVIFQQDAVHLSQKIEKGSLDAIITEPFLGNPALGEGKITDKEQIKDIVKGLEKLYIGCFKGWYSLLKSDGKIVIAFPLIVVEEYKQTVKKLIDTCESLGYSIQAGPLEYSRPKAIVRRQFYIFRKI